MRLLKIFCIFFCLFSLASAFTGVHAIQYSFVGNVVTRKIATDHSRLGVYLSLAYALLFAAAAYGIERRAMITWRLGFAYLLIAYLAFNIQVLLSTVKLPQGWIAAVAMVVASSLIFLWWRLWWKRQRGYFSSIHN